MADTFGDTREQLDAREDARGTGGVVVVGGVRRHCGIALEAARDRGKEKGMSVAEAVEDWPEVERFR